MEKIIINTDGGSRGNPGKAGVGFVVSQNGEIMHQCGEYVGIKTNNEAEYLAVIAALNWLVKNSKDIPTEIEFKLDSQLVVSQLNGKYKIKHPPLQTLASQIHQTIQSLKSRVTFSHVYREQNKQADLLVNQALDAQK